MFSSWNIDLQILLYILRKTHQYFLEWHCSGSWNQATSGLSKCHKMPKVHRKATLFQSCQLQHSLLNFQDVPILRSSPDLPKTGSTQASPPVGLVDVGTWVLVPCCPKISIQPHTRNIHVTTFRLLMSSLSDSWIHRYVCFPGVGLKKNDWLLVSNQCTLIESVWCSIRPSLSIFLSKEDNQMIVVGPTLDSWQICCGGFAEF